MEFMDDRWSEDSADGLVDVVRHEDVLVLEQQPELTLALEAESGTPEPGAERNE